MHIQAALPGNQGILIPGICHAVSSNMLKILYKDFEDYWNFVMAYTVFRGYGF